MRNKDLPRNTRAARQDPATSDAGSSQLSLHIRLALDERLEKIKKTDVRRGGGGHFAGCWVGATKEADEEAE
jgi:hypothetical protein